MSPEHCATQLLRLMTLKGMPEDTTEYFPALSDIPELVFTEAVSHALKSRAWFPVPAELRIDCDVAASQFRSAVGARAPQVMELVGGGRAVTIANPFGGPPLELTIDRVWKFDCEACADSGWRSRQCPADPCGRRHDHAPHEFVEPCACREWNPTIRRRNDAMGATYSQSPARVA